MKLYHGTNVTFENFDNKFIGTSSSIDQYGSGFYFFDNPDDTRGYGDITVTVDAEINKPILWENRKKHLLTRPLVKKLISVCPDLKDKLSNFGDIEWEGYNSVLKTAIDSYVDMNVIDGLNAIGNDFFDFEDTHILLSKFVKETGYNAIIDTTTGIYVILTVNQIKIIKD